jgi:hypothetical protein
MSTFTSSSREAIRRSFAWRSDDRATVTGPDLTRREAAGMVGAGMLAAALPATVKAQGEPAAARSGKTLRPEAGRIFSGAGQDVVAYAAMTNAAEPERQPYLIADYDGIGNGPGLGVSTGVLRSTIIAPGAALQIGYDLPWQDEAKLRSVAAGAYDRDIDVSAATYREMATPVLLRIGYEYDMAWTGYAPEPYRAAFRHVVERFRAAGADNVGFVWDSATHYHTDFLARWYPGDDVVDWWAYNVWGHHDARGFVEEARKHGKPTLIGEFSLAFAGGGPWPIWYPQAMDSIRASGVLAYQYINFDWRWIGEWEFTERDGTISDQPDRLALHREEMRRPDYQHRGAEHFNPNALLVNAARRLRRDQGSPDWSPALDFATMQPGFGYRVAGARAVRDESGWDKGWTAAGADGRFTVTLNGKAGAAGHLTVGYQGTGTLDLAVDGHPLAQALSARRSFDATGVTAHVVTFPTRFGRDGTRALQCRVAGGTMKITDIAFLRIAPDAPAAPRPRATPGGARWAPVAGADRYNLYRDHELVGFTRDPRTDLRGSIAVSAWNARRGEGPISAPVTVRPRPA